MVQRDLGNILLTMALSAMPVMAFADVNLKIINDTSFILEATETSASGWGDVSGGDKLSTIYPQKEGQAKATHNALPWFTLKLNVYFSVMDNDGVPRENCHVRAESDEVWGSAKISASCDATVYFLKGVTQHVHFDPGSISWNDSIVGPAFSIRFVEGAGDSVNRSYG